MAILRSILHLTVNDFQLCDIINGRRVLFNVNITPENCQQIVSCDENGTPYRFHEDFIPVRFTHQLFESIHSLLKGEKCLVEIKGIKVWKSAKKGVVSTNPYFEYHVSYTLGKTIWSSSRTDYVIR